MRFLVLGAGLQGSACAYDLLQQDDVETVTLADLHPERAADFVPDDPRLTKIAANFRDDAAVRGLMTGHDVVLSAAPYYFNGDLAQAAAESGCHFGDLGGNTEIVQRQLAMADLARSNDCMLVPDLGLAPGMINILGVEAVRRLDRADSLMMYVGGLPQHPQPPLNYQVVYSLEGMIDYVTTGSKIIRDGRIQDIGALTEIEHLEFDGIGTLEAFHTAGGASTLPEEYAGQLKELAYKTLRYPGHAELLGAIRALGLLDTDPVNVKGTEVIPREAFIAIVSPALTKPEEPDLVALRVVASGEKDGEAATLSFEVVDRANPATGISAMERTTGFTLSIAGLFLGRGVIEERGAAASHRTIPYDPYVAELERRGIHVRTTG
jgi:lysine 6-dehydrogenase